jgi:hypothetical protein
VAAALARGGDPEDRGGSKLGALGGSLLRAHFQDMEERERDQLGNEWVTVCALREVINVAKRGKRKDNVSTYRKAVALAEELMPIMDPENRTTG